MDLNEISKPNNLERYSFLWSEARLIIAAVALFIGGVPPVRFFMPSQIFYGLVGTILNLSWLISGISSAYLFYRWYYGQQMLFGAKEPMDTYAFWISTVSGINLGIAGLVGYNIGMSISSNYFIFVIVALIYLASAYQLYKSWDKHGQKVF